MTSGFETQRRAANAASNTGHFCREFAISSARISKARSFIDDLPSGSSILDVGCSDGAMLEPFVGRLEVHGVDASRELVDVANSRGLRAMVADVESLPFDNATFDAVFAGEVIEHTISPDRCLSEINRVLKPLGTLILTAPNIRTPIGVAMLLYGLPPMYAARYRSSHFRDFTARLLKLALRNNGFEVEKFTGSAFMIPKFGPRFARLADVFPSWADNFIVKAIRVAESRYDAEAEFLPL
jgi:SAM-dependent methyltransferase